jgi:hypothetical protein
VTQKAPEFWTQAAQQFQQSVMSESWTKAMQSLPEHGSWRPRSGHAGRSRAKAARDSRIAPEKLQALQQQYLQDAMGLFSQGYVATPPAIRQTSVLRVKPGPATRSQPTLRRPICSMPEP